MNRTLRKRFLNMLFVISIVSLHSCHSSHEPPDAMLIGDSDIAFDGHIGGDGDLIWECEESVEGRRPWERVELRFSAKDHLGGAVELHNVEFMSAPFTSKTTLVRTSSTLVEFVPDVLGEYIVVAYALDPRGMISACRSTIKVPSEHFLRIELTWEAPTGDLDLVLAHERYAYWFDREWSCYTGSCLDIREVDWGGIDVSPRLDRDDKEGSGPEAITMLHSNPGVYHIGVHAFEGRGLAWLRIFCGVGSLVPHGVLGPVQLDRGEWRAFWQAGDLEIGTDSCVIHDRGEDILSQLHPGIH